MWRHIASNALTLLAVMLVLAGGLVLWGKEQFSGPGPLAEAICFRVDSGASFTSIASNLKAADAISNVTVFRAGADYAGKAGQQKLGSYLIQPGASMETIVDQVTTAGRSTCGTEVTFRIGILRAEMQVRELDPTTNRYVELAAFNPSEAEVPEAYVDAAAKSDTRFRVVLAEGVTSWQVVEELKSAPFLVGDVAVPDEGSLAPDSYEVTSGSERGVLIERMQTAQVQILEDLWQSRADGLPLETAQEALVLASIIEKETGVPDERGQVASVFVNRLKQGIRLQTDPTVIYGVTNGQGALGRGLRQSELRRETPYNTYLIDGLPPTPIANPGRASIEAALNPDSTEFIFFVADGSGGHAFAKTLAEHNANVAIWRQIEADRAQ